MAAREASFHGGAFTANWGVAQGDLLPPNSFNVKADAVVHPWLDQVCDQQVTKQRLGVKIRKKAMIFYADGRWFWDRNGEWFQANFGNLVGYFEQVSMQINATKTKEMILITLFF